MNERCELGVPTFGLWNLYRLAPALSPRAFGRVAIARVYVAFICIL